MTALPATAEPPEFASDSRTAEEIVSRPRRQLACVLCQKRKVKCDHRDPCATCVKSSVQCVRVQNQRRRKRRFPERELLDRLHEYEILLDKHNIKFKPLHPRETGTADAISLEERPDSQTEDLYDADDEPRRNTVGVSPSPATTSSERRSVRGAKRMLHTMNQEFRDRTDGELSGDEVDEAVFKAAWDQTIEDDAHVLFGFGSQQTVVDLYSLHPQPFQILQLWQLYLDNVDPLLKVTHPQSFQKRIIAAASNISNISSELEALMFGIYCMAITSLAENGCQSMFGSPKMDFLAKFQLGCQQALRNSRFMRTTSRDCLVALYLYLISVRPITAPHSLCSMLGIAIRIGQRIGIHSEAILAKSSFSEAEIGRRLWWSLILFDSRIGEMADLHATSLLPTWDCRIPLSVNDSDLHELMNEPPQVQGKITDSLFAVARCELGDFVRHTKFHLGFYGPGLCSSAAEAKQGSEGTEMDGFMKAIEDKYLKSCDPENVLHFMTIWTTRGHVAKCRLMEHHFQYSGSSLHQADSQREAALTYALRMLECNTKLMTSPLTRGFIWMVYSHFPFIGYIQIIQHLKWRPISARAPEAWEVMNDNYRALLEVLSVSERFFTMLTNMILEAWEARETAYGQSEESLETPQLVSSIRQSQALQMPDANSWVSDQSFLMEMGSLYYPLYHELDMDRFDWSTMDLDLESARQQFHVGNKPVADTLNRK